MGPCAAPLGAVQEPPGLGAPVSNDARATGALVVHGHDPVAAVASLAGHVAHVHATDAVAGAFAGRGRAVVLGTGHVDFPAVFAALEERGYRGWIGLEPVEDRSASAELAAAADFLRAL